MTNAPKLSPHDVRRVAVESLTNPRTVQAYLAGNAKQPMVIARIKAAMIKLGFAQAEPQSKAA